MAAVEPISLVDLHVPAQANAASLTLCAVPLTTYNEG